MKRYRWTQKEIDILKQLYPIEVEWQKILLALPGRTALACRLKARSLNICRPYRLRDYWTQEEENLLARLYTTEPDWDKILGALPGRAKTSCITRASILRLTRTKTGIPLGEQPALPILPITAAYLAGAIDCDGTISLKLSKRKSGNLSIAPYIGFYNTNKAVIDWMQQHLNEHIVTTLRVRINPISQKLLYNFKVNSMSAIARVLRTILPYLVQKTRQAEIVLLYCENHPFYTPASPDELDYVTEIRLLNRRGNPKYLL